MIDVLMKRGESTENTKRRRQDKIEDETEMRGLQAKKLQRLKVTPEAKRKAWGQFLHQSLLTL